jgi:hypothetical protein
MNQIRGRDGRIERGMQQAKWRRERGLTGWRRAAKDSSLLARNVCEISIWGLSIVDALRIP